MDETQVAYFLERLYGEILSAPPLQQLHLERLEPKESELCANTSKAAGFRGTVTAMNGRSCRFTAWKLPFDEVFRYGWVLRGADLPDRYVGHNIRFDFGPELRSFLE